VHHQHFFNLRLDFDVDGEANSVSEIETTPAPAGPDNPYGNAVKVEETVLRTEKGAERDVDFATQRKWRIFSPSRKNALGQNPGYLLIPGETSLSFLAPDSPVRRKARFLDHQFWVTRQDPAERYAAGVYPNQGEPEQGLPRFVADDQPIEGRDVVVWYTFGVTHAPRPEEWPVMPVHRTGFSIVPAGFYDRNPALGPQRN
jgi:primary-amine oxidase